VCLRAPADEDHDPQRDQASDAQHRVDWAGDQCGAGRVERVGDPWKGNHRSQYEQEEQMADDESSRPHDI
jgi:hypothetical protein